MGARPKHVADAAIAALEDGRDPLHIEFLAEHDLTFDEAHALAERMALGLRIVDLIVTSDPQILAGALNGANMAAAYRTLNAALTGLDKSPPTT